MTPGTVVKSTHEGPMTPQSSLQVMMVRSLQFGLTLSTVSKPEPMVSRWTLPGHEAV